MTAAQHLPYTTSSTSAKWPQMSPAARVPDRIRAGKDEPCLTSGSNTGKTSLESQPKTPHGGKGRGQWNKRAPQLPTKVRRRPTDPPVCHPGGISEPPPHAPRQLLTYQEFPCQGAEPSQGHLPPALPPAGGWTELARAGPNPSCHCCRWSQAPSSTPGAPPPPPSAAGRT